VALDGITDPHNVGSVIRSSAFFGVEGIIISENRIAPLNPPVSKSSAGALEYFTIVHTKVLHRFLSQCKSKGWTILGTLGVKNAANVNSYSLKAPAILVLGSEGEGLSSGVSQLCDTLLQIEGVPSNSGNAQLLDSLNVGVASGIILHHLTSKQ